LIRSSEIGIEISCLIARRIEEGSIIPILDVGIKIRLPKIQGLGLTTIKGMDQFPSWLILNSNSRPEIPLIFGSYLEIRKTGDIGMVQ
jgi:hypothetical protein